jgi:hypothetical protein
VGVGAGVGVAEAGVDVGEVRDGRGGVEDSIDERGEGDELPDLSDEGGLGTRVGVGVVVRGGGVRVSVGVVTTPTRLRAGCGAGRTSRYVTSVSRNVTLSTTVEVLARWWIRITPCRWVARCPGLAAR